MKQWQGISELVAVADEGSFTLAAQSLQISVAQVSRNIAALEQRLNIKLLHRSTRRVHLTEEGKLYLNHCRHIVESLEDADHSIASLMLTPRGRLKITAPVFYGETRLAPLLHEFLTRHPDVSLELQLTNTQLNLIQGGFDLAIRLGSLESSSLIARKLGTRTQYIVGAPEYFNQRPAPQRPDELSNHECLRGSLDVWRLQDDKGQPLHFRPQGRIHCNSGPALLDAALRGLGLVQLPGYYIEEHLKSGALMAVLNDFRTPDDGIWAVYPENRLLSAKVRHLVDFLSQQLA